MKNILVKRFMHRCPVATPNILQHLLSTEFRFHGCLLLVLVAISSFAAVPHLTADPCGMVPPVQVKADDAIKRVGAQKTYLFYRNGIESFVVRPGFEGKVDNFGMLIPFPDVPSIRKVPNNIFPQIAAAIDPPEIMVTDEGNRGRNLLSSSAHKESEPEDLLSVRKDEVRVKKQEAVGMYRTAVLEAGSAKALKRWMAEHGYKYPGNMDDATQDYVEAGWCFVAVKARVASKASANPKPGMREADPDLPEGASFDGKVQAMGFRFRTEEPVAPMRLSAYNRGKLHNITYVLTDAPKRINDLPKEMVKRQVSGEKLYRNVTAPLPVRVVDDRWKDLSETQRQRVRARRDPDPHNGQAKELFQSDLLAARKDRLVHGYEKKLKALLDIEEALNLRGEGIDRFNRKHFSSKKKRARRRALASLKDMTLTVLDGEFPREVLKRQNLTFSTYRMPTDRNGPSNYNARKKGPADEKNGKLYRGFTPDPVRKQGGGGLLLLLMAVSCFLPFANRALSGRNRGSRNADRRGSAHSKLLLGVVTMVVSVPVGLNVVAQVDVQKQMRKLTDRDRAAAAVHTLVNHPDASLSHLAKSARTGVPLRQRGWSIVALSRIGGEVATHELQAMMNDESEPRLVRLLAAAGRIRLLANPKQMVRWIDDQDRLIEQFPVLTRPIRLRAREISGSGNIISYDDILLKLAGLSDELRRTMADRIRNLGVKRLTELMTSSRVRDVRRDAAAYLGALAQQGRKKAVVKAVREAFSFSPGAKREPWGNGLLLLPKVEWSQSDATPLVRDFLSWMIHAYERDDEAVVEQIHDSVQSRLREATGIELPDGPGDGFGSGSGGFGSTSGGFGNRPSTYKVIPWLSAWKSAHGREDLRALLEEQNLFEKRAELPRASIQSTELNLMLATISKQFRARIEKNVTEIGAIQFARVMTRSIDEEVRQRAASYLETLAGRGRRDTVVKTVQNVLSFNAHADHLPWAGGPLLLPRIDWTKSEATPLVRDLLSWMIRAHKQDDEEALGEIHSSVRTLFNEQDLFVKREKTLRESFHPHELNLMLATISEQFRAKLKKNVSEIGAMWLARLMTQSGVEEVRQLAASYLETLAGRGKRDAVVQAVQNAFAFTPGADRLPWAGGPLLLPRIDWTKSEATPLVRNLLSWMVRAHALDEEEVVQNIHNAVRRPLRKASGIRLPDEVQSDSGGFGNNSGGFGSNSNSGGFGSTSGGFGSGSGGFDQNNTNIIIYWLNAWKSAHGREDLRALLEEQNLFAKRQDISRESIDSTELNLILILSTISKEFRTKIETKVAEIGAERLAALMTQSGVEEVRHLAASFLETLTGQGRRDAVLNTVRDILSFNPGADRLPWQGGRLVLPRIDWTKSEATPLVRNLLSWMIRAHERPIEPGGGFQEPKEIVSFEKTKRKIMKQLWSTGNDGSSSLSSDRRDLFSSVIAYVKKSRYYLNGGGFDNSDRNEPVKLIELLKSWKTVMGNRDLKTVLKEQNLLKKNPYRRIVD